MGVEYLEGGDVVHHEAMPVAVAFADDRSALLAMHYASNGHAWYRRDGRRWTGWIETSPLDEWSGVAVGEGRAVILNLYMCNLMGFIAPELGQLGALQQLDLGKNKIFGSIPSELGQLWALTKLDLYGNELSGPIPSELGQLANLKEINLGCNHLLGPIPPELGQLSSLELLRLHNNLLSGEIPLELCQLRALRVLKLNKNRLCGPIPPQLGVMTNLVSLWLNNNELSGRVPQQLGALSALESLWLHRNKDIRCFNSGDACSAAATSVFRAAPVEARGEDHLQDIRHLMWCYMVLHHAQRRLATFASPR